VIDQSPTPQLCMEAFHLLRSRFELIEQSLKNSLANPDCALLGAENDAELDGGAIVVPAGTFWECEKDCDLRRTKGMFSLCFYHTSVCRATTIGGRRRMVASDSFAEFLREQLAPLGSVSMRRMFGKTGVFYDGVMFGMVTANVLYLRVDDYNRVIFKEAESFPSLS
jgi:hypothetical protein